MAQASGAMTSAQVELAKAYTAKETTYVAAYDKAVKALNGTKPVVSAILAYTDDAATDGNELRDTKDPGTVKSYKVTFTDGKVAIVTTNDVVKLQ